MAVTPPSKPPIPTPSGAILHGIVASVMGCIAVRTLEKNMFPHLAVYKQSYILRDVGAK